MSSNYISKQGSHDGVHWVVVQLYSKQDGELLVMMDIHLFDYTRVAPVTKALYMYNRKLIPGII